MGKTLTFPSPIYQIGTLYYGWLTFIHFNRPKLCFSKT